MLAFMAATSATPYFVIASRNILTCLSVTRPMAPPSNVHWTVGEAGDLNYRFGATSDALM
jgi:hypothetical protein